MTAKYLQIAREIKKRIISQQYPASAPLPDQFALAAEFNTSRMTIQQAMRQLIVEGLIYTRKGLGTFVRKIFSSCRSGSCPAATILAPPKPGSILARYKAKWCALRCVFPATKSRVRC